MVRSACKGERKIRLGTNEIILLGIIVAVIAVIIGVSKAVSSAGKTPVRNETMSSEPDVGNNIEKLSQIKDLLDKGVITQEEYEVKKKQILGH